MSAQIELIEGTNRDLSLSQWFTPSDLAKRVVEWAVAHHWPDGSARAEGRHGPLRVLEPSAGNGALVRPLVAAGARVDAIELDARYSADLWACKPDWMWCPANFLETEPPTRDPFDLCVMNPPYEDGKDVAFILHALKFAPRVVGIFTDRILFGVERKKSLWSKVRPMRVAFCSQRPFKGAQTDYVVLELMKRLPCEADNNTFSDKTRMEFW